MRGNSWPEPRPSCWDGLDNVASCECLWQVWEHRGQSVDPDARGTTKSSRWGERELWDSVKILSTNRHDANFGGILLHFSCGLKYGNSYCPDISRWEKLRWALDYLNRHQNRREAPLGSPNHFKLAQNLLKKTFTGHFFSFREKQILWPSGFWIFYKAQGSTITPSLAHNNH